MRGSRKSLFKSFGACGAPANHSVKGLAFPRRAKVISRRVWHFRAWRKSFPERFGISALGESRFLKGFAFPRMAKVVSRRVWRFRAWRKSFPERFDLCRYVETTRNLQSAEDRKYRLHKAESLFDILTHDGNENPIAWIWRYRLKMLFLQKIGGVRQIENKFSLRSLAQSLFVALKR